MNFGQIRNCLCNLEQRVEALEAPGDIITENPDGGDPVEIQLGDYSEAIGILASGYVIISINGTKYKLLAELISI
jgi:hypothetical protein